MQPTLWAHPKGPLWSGLHFLSNFLFPLTPLSHCLPLCPHSCSRSWLFFSSSYTRRAYECFCLEWIGLPPDAYMSGVFLLFRPQLTYSLSESLPSFPPASWRIPTAPHDQMILFHCYQGSYYTPHFLVCLSVCLFADCLPYEITRFLRMQASFCPQSIPMLRKVPGTESVLSKWFFLLLEE